MLKRIEAGEDPLIAKRQAEDRHIEQKKRTFDAVVETFLTKHAQKKAGGNTPSV